MTFLKLSVIAGARELRPLTNVDWKTQTGRVEVIIDCPDSSGCSPIDRLRRFKRDVAIRVNP